jgi:hypothetical protein
MYNIINPSGNENQKSKRDTSSRSQVGKITSTGEDAQKLEPLCITGVRFSKN